MTAATVTVVAIFAFVIGLSSTKPGGRSASTPEPLSDRDADQVRSVIADAGPLWGVKRLRSLRPDLSLKDARSMASKL